MVNLHTFRQQAVEMGQRSSQPGPSAPLEPAEELDAHLHNAKGKKQGKRKGKRKSGAVEEEGDEEGTARALMQLSADAVVNARQPSYDDDLAASAQLIAESSPLRPFKSREVEGQVEGQEERRRQKKIKSRKRRRDRSKLSPTNARLLDIEEERLRNTQHTQNDHPVMSPANIPRSTFSLDDIDSHDEAVASYLHEYENGVASPHHPTTSEIDHMEPENPEQRVATETGSAPSGNGIYSKYPALPLIYTPRANGKENRKRKNPSDGIARNDEDDNQEPSDGVSQLSGNIRSSSVRPEKHNKKKRKKATNSVLDNGYDEHQRLMNGTGQHVFDHDFEAFDQYMIQNGIDSANLLDRDPGHTMPIDPQLIRESDLIARAEHDAFIGSNDAVTRQTSQTGKLKRVSLLPGKPRTLASSQANGSSSSYTSPYAFNGNQHNGVVPAMEDRQMQQSPELGSHGPAGVDANSCSSPSDSYRPEKSKPKSEKRSKSLGTNAGHHERGRNNYHPSTKEIADKGGMFTTAEIAKLDAFRDAYCEENEINTWQFNELIHTRIRGNPKVVRLFGEIHEILPYRKHASTQRFCRRRYHNFSARGSWTTEEDERLKQAIAEKGKSWKAVGEMVERMPEDCRDRWRNYLINGDNRNKEKWTDAEVKNLITAVYDCIKVMRQARRVEKMNKYAGRDVPDSEPDTNEAEEMKLINWQAVSDRMGENGGGRSRLQCSHKYNKLKLADQRTYMRQIREAGENMRRLEEGRPPKKSSLSNEGWRYRRAKKRVANMKTGDKYDFLQVLSTCKALDEGNIPWNYLGDDKFQARWSRLERIAAWETMKKAVLGSEKMDYHDIVNRLLTKMMAEDVEHLGERWDPEVDGDINEEGNFKKLTRRQERRSENKQKERPRRKGEREAGVADSYRFQNSEKPGKSVKPKSALFVSTSDEEDLEVDETNDQDSGVVGNGNEYEVLNYCGQSRASDAEDEPQGLRESDGSEDAEQPGSEEGQENNVEDSDEESRFADGNMSDDLGDRIELLRNI